MNPDDVQAVRFGCVKNLRDVHGSRRRLEELGREKSLQGAGEIWKRCEKLTERIHDDATVANDMETLSAFNEGISGVTGDIRRMRFNTAISKLSGSYWTGLRRRGGFVTS